MMRYDGGRYVMNTMALTIATAVFLRHAGQFYSSVSRHHERGQQKWEGPHLRILGVVRSIPSHNIRVIFIGTGNLLVTV